MTNNTRLSATHFLLFINACVWLFDVVIQWYSNSNVFFLLGAKYTPLIIQGQYWRLITPVFLHLNLLHLLMNEYSLYLLGPLVEKTYGKLRFLIIYIIAGITGNIASAYFLPDVLSIGASGAIFGLLGAWLYLGLKYRSQLPKMFLSNVVAMIVINMAYGVIRSNIDNYAHLGGLLGGFLMTVIIDSIHSKSYMMSV